MRNSLQHISLLFWVCVGLVLGACTSDSISDRQLLLRKANSGSVTLQLNVSLDNIRSSSSTRDGEEEEESENSSNQPEYEEGLEPFELIHTLRVIIVRPDNTVEYNRLITLPDNTSAKQLANLEELKFDASTSQGKFIEDGKICLERKRIYLIANEASLKSAGSEETANIIEALTALRPTNYDKSDEDDETKVIIPGEKLDPNKVATWLVYNNWSEEGTNLYAEPMIDNDNTTDKKFIPMTEFFDIDVKVDLTLPSNQLSEQRENLFITRNLVKFQFSVEGGEETFKIHKVTFSNLMCKEYMFPFDTKYKPSKYPVNSEDREIIAFKTPGLADNFVRPYDFLPDNFGIVSDNFSGNLENLMELSAVYSPMLYFCETENYETNNEKGIYRVGIDIEFFNADGTSQRTTFEAKELENLSSIPRNTIVKVNFKISNRELIDCVVTLVPYISIVLEPGFGFDELLPGDHSIPPAGW